MATSGVENMNVQQINNLLNQFKNIKEPEGPCKLPQSASCLPSGSFTLREYLLRNNIPVHLIEPILIAYISDIPYTFNDNKTETWYIITTQEQHKLLWIKHCSHKTRFEMEKLYNTPIVLKYNCHGHNKLTVFDIFNRTTKHTKYYVETVSLAESDLIQKVKNTWISGIPLNSISSQSINGIKLSDIVNAFPDNQIESKQCFKRLCDSKIKHGYLNNKERSLMKIYNFTLKQINEAIGFKKKEHKVHKSGKERKVHVFTEQTKAKLNTYHNRKIYQSDIEQFFTPNEKIQTYMDKIEQL